MKTRSPQNRTPPISKARWIAYATAGAATALMTVPHAEAEIHYSGKSVRLTGDSVVDLPLSNGASLEFRLFGRGTTYQQAATCLLQGAISGSARAYKVFPNGTAGLSDLELHDPVSDGPFASVQGNPGRGFIFAYGFSYYFYPPGGIIGFKFNTGKGTQYGWARVRTDLVFRYHEHLHLIVEDYAWGDAGDSIQAGQKHSAPEQADAVPKNGSLGLLAAGRVGLQAWRESRVQKQTDGR